MPRFDGLYFGSARDGVSLWLRFWEDGVVMSATTTGGGAAQVASWLRQDRPADADPRGRWTQKGSVLRFNESWTVNGKAHESKSVATELEGGLDVAWTNAGLGRAGTQRYAFIPLLPEDLEGPKRAFPAIKNLESLKGAGLSAAALTRLRKAPKLVPHHLYVMTAAELVERAGLSPEEAERLVRWRDARE